MKKKVELLAPAGDFASLKAACNASADSIYFGIDRLNMRSNSANNFSIDSLKEIEKICKSYKVKRYLTLNTLIYDDDLELAKEICRAAKESNIDAIIASDLSIIGYANSLDLNVNFSTQMNISNIEALKFLSKFGDAAILARELSLDQINGICSYIKKNNLLGRRKKPMKVEIFIHGALCTAISGKCYMSLSQYGRSANRGSCLQPCRRKYRVIEEETGKELLLDNNYVMSPKDLCTIPFLDKIVESGVDILKIEGRARSPEYVKTVVETYREALRSIEDKTFSKERIDSFIKRVKTVYNRGFWYGGYYLGKSLDIWSRSYGSKASLKKIYIGKITNYFSKIGVCEVLLHSGSLKVSDNILIIGSKTGVYQGKIEKIRKDSDIQKAMKGDLVTFPVKGEVRRGDKLYILV